jgi:P27 family predicted phage terminase small subunit
MPGPPPTPTDILAFRGSDLPGRKGARGRKREPKPEKKAPPCPRRLSAKQRAVWKETVLLLRKMLTVADGPMLELYCQVVVEAREYRATIDKHGLAEEIQTKGGGTYNQTRSEVAELRDRRATMMKIMAQFGMSKLARLHLDLEPDDEAKPVTVRDRK